MVNDKLAVRFRVDESYIDIDLECGTYIIHRNRMRSIKVSTHHFRIVCILRFNSYKEMLFLIMDSEPNKSIQDLLTENIRERSTSCGLIVIDNFYNNAMETRKYILTEDFKVRGNYPGQRTRSFATSSLKDIIQSYVLHFGGKITQFPMPDESNKNDNEIYNGAFQYTTSRDSSWVHVDGNNNWAGVLYMTPDAPLSSGTGFYKYKDGNTCEYDLKIMNNKEELDTFSQDMTKWEQVDKVGNVFNRLILFNSKKYHRALDYFGNSKESGRLFQVFFFSTEK
jgi:hypothetical protein